MKILAKRNPIVKDLDAPKMENISCEGVALKDGVQVFLTVEPHEVNGNLLLSLIVLTASGDFVDVDLDNDLPRTVVPDGAVSVRSLLQEDFSTDFGKAVGLAVACLIAPIAALSVKRFDHMVEFTLAVGGFTSQGFSTIGDLDRYFSRVPCEYDSFAELDGDASPVN